MAVKYAMDNLGVKKVAVVDWDVRALNWSVIIFLILIVYGIGSSREWNSKLVLEHERYLLSRQLSGSRNAHEALGFIDVLTISIHQHLCFPANSGYITERGGKGAEGYA